MSRITQIFILFLNFSVLIGYSQNSYQVNFLSQNNEKILDMIEDMNGNIVAVGARNIQDYYRETNDGMIWKIASNMDTISKVYSFPDTTSHFCFIEQKQNGNYIIIGTVEYLPIYKTGDLIMLEINDELEIIKKKIINGFDFDNTYNLIQFVKHIGDNYYIFGGGNFNGDPIPTISKLDSNFNLIRHVIFWDWQLSTGVFMDCIQAPDSLHLYIFTHGLTDMIGGLNALYITDTALNVIQIKDLPYFFNQSTNTLEVLYEGNLTAKWITDSTFLIGCNHSIIDFDIPPVGQNYIGFSELDTSMSLVPITLIGSPDTNDIAGDFQCFDFINNNRIFYTGTKGRISTFFPQDPSWIRTGMMDRNRNIMYERIYGGDAYYKPMIIKALTDNGSIIAAHRYDYLTQGPEYDVCFFKLNDQGLITNISNNIDNHNNFKIYPNPVSKTLHIELTGESAKLKLYDMFGAVVIESVLNSGNNSFNVSNLRCQVYILEIIDKLDNSYYVKIIRQ